MKIVVSGLGIIGASVCASLRAAGYTVYGKNRGRDALEYALEHGYIDGEATTYEDADVVFLALPPDITMRELDTAIFQDGAIVADICGIKGLIEDVVYSKPRNYRYVGTHPMAGKETSGVRSASATLFRGANLILTRHEKTDEKAFQTVKDLAVQMGFGYLLECSAAVHDKKIAITSQLAHIVANAYAKSDEAQDCGGFTGGSFQDMTRIAGVDEAMWTQLYFCNRENLLFELEGLVERLGKYRDALAQNDEGKMKDLLREGRILHETSKKKREKISD
ncbi:MAG: prephenate dehydrogenase/arogenate dehydrogenase family protein [Clostridia bacterium]|nr:prephenate dehydrogenase/arogenate dehydrogenase family protein [Clostridia bacterium]